MPIISELELSRRRQSIIDAARACFARYGFEGATVARLEEATGKTRGAIFHHFDDKEALFLAIVSEDVKRQAEVVSQRGLCLLYTSPSPRDRQKSRMPSSA